MTACRWLVVNIGLMPAVPWGTLLVHFRGMILAAVLVGSWHRRLQDNFDFVGNCPMAATWFIRATIGCRLSRVGAFTFVLGVNLHTVTFG